MPLSHARRMTLSIVGGFAFSFFVLLFSVYSGRFAAMRGQLVAGDQAANRQLPTTLNMLHGAFDGTDPMIAALSNGAWWIMVMIVGCVFSVVLFRLTRRFV